MKDIKAYLLQKDRDFQEGLVLLKKHSKNTHVIQLLTVKGATPEMVAKLEKNLASIAEIDFNTDLSKKLDKVAEKMVIDSQKKESLATNDLSLTTETHTPNQELIDSLEVEITALFNKRNQLSNTLADQESDEDRLLVVAQIEDINTEIEAKKVLISKEVSGEKEVVIAEKKINPDVAVITVEIQKLREKASKLKKKIQDNPTSAKLIEWQEDFAKTSALLEEKETEKKLAETANGSQNA